MDDKNRKNENATTGGNSKKSCKGNFTRRGQRCIACKNNCASDSYFRFPQNSSRKLLWMSRLKLENAEISSKSKLCHNHFTSDDYTTHYNETGTVIVKRILKKEAKPSYIDSKKDLTRKVSNSRKCLYCKTNDPQLGYFPFPFEDHVRFQKWIEFCEVFEEEVLPSYVLCSKHFPSTCIIGSLEFGKRRKLVPDAIPTIKESTEIGNEIVSSTPRILLNNAECSNTEIEHIIVCPVLQENETSHADGPSTLSNYVEHSNTEIDIKKRVTVCSESEKNEMDNVTHVFLNDTELSRPSTPTDPLDPEDYIICETLSISSSTSPPTPTGRRTPEPENFTVPKYIGAIRSPHLSTPRRAKACFDYAKKIILAKNKQIKTKDQTIQRLKEKNAALRSQCNHWKKQFEIAAFGETQSPKKKSLVHSRKRSREL